MIQRQLNRLLFMGIMVLSWGAFEILFSPQFIQAQSDSFPTRVRCLTPPQRIAFSPNGYAGSVIYQLTKNCTEAQFFLAAKAGQVISLVLSSPGPAQFEIIAPDGIQEKGSVDTDGVIFNKPVNRTGDYQIRITESTVAQPWSGQIILTAVLQPKLRP